MALQWPLRDATSPDFALSKSIDGELLTLVFSDEFNVPNRSFKDGDDPHVFGRAVQME